MIDFSKSFSEESFIDFLRGFLPDFEADRRAAKPESKILPEVVFLGESERLKTAVFVARTSTGINSRVSLAKASFKLMRNHGVYRALIAYVSPDQKLWRLSLLTAQPTWVEGKVVQIYSSPVRFSYVLGSEVGVATARKFLLNMGPVSNFEDLTYRFSVEAINKEFYSDVSRYFYELIGLYDSAGTEVQPPKLQLPESATYSEQQEYGIRLLGRIIFCWFLREKRSEQGVQLLPSAVFDQAVKNEDSVLQKVLEPLFFECFNTPMEDRQDAFRAQDYGHVPYLNGGLFSPQEGPGGDYLSSPSSSDVSIPDSWIKGLFETLQTYNFTLDENLDYDVELSIDPEMLGRIFENLLAEINPETGDSARRTTGSFYTPRKIVGYMTTMSLQRLLTERTSVAPERISELLRTHGLEDQDIELDSREQQEIAETLYSLKSIDPACGSGAFPIGLMQQLIPVLEVVDPDFGIGIKRLAQLGTLRSVSVEANINYLRKLLLIRDVLHGVDIQPIAVELSKLRCFLTLIVDQMVDDDLPNRGLDPLPNLDFQFVCADSLIPLDDEAQGIIWEDESLESELTSIRDTYYSTNSTKKRERLRSRYGDLVNQELTLFGDTPRTAQLKTFNPFAVQNQASFFDPRVMFGVDCFDLVIGNPPYVKTEHLSEQVRSQLRANYSEQVKGKVRDWLDDLYSHFIFRAFDLAKQGGLVCFITNDSFIGHQSKERIRKKLLGENLLSLTACPRETFGATIYTAIFMAERCAEKDSTYSTARFTYPEFQIESMGSVSKDYVRRLPSERLVFNEDPLVSRLISLPHLSELARILDTGIDSGNIREKLFSSVQTPTHSARLIQGRQIQRWAVDWNSPQAKYRYCDPNYVPKDAYGVGRGGKASSKKEYWSFRGDESNHFLEERILLRQTSDSLFAAYQNIDHDGQLFTDNTLFTIVPRGTYPIKYILALLNSRLLNYVYRYLSAEEGKILAQVKVGLVERLPAPYSEPDVEPVIGLVDQLIEARRNDPQADVSDLERKLDEKVCRIYGLSVEEIEDLLGSKC